MKRRCPARIVLLFLLLSSAVSAQGFFLPASDARLRDDLALLVDAGVMDLPLNEWPVPRADVAQALTRVDPVNLQGAALHLALARVEAHVVTHPESREWNARDARVVTGQPGLLRDFDTLGRSNGELTVTAGRTTGRYNVLLSLTGVVDAEDRKMIRFDGSDITLRLGNWMLGVNQMDRWWGPGHSGSLILSTNARPMPAVSLDRARSLPFDVPVLRWLGPWRFSSFLGVMESDRPDVDQPLYMAMRLSFKPSTMFEFALSRSALFCGKGRQCSLETFGRMLIGQDNVYLRGLDDPEDEPGNQLGGFDFRLVSPARSVPVALYGQMIGEDFSDSGLPIRFLYQAGAETWWTLEEGSVFRARVEHADTSTGIYKVWEPTDPHGPNRGTTDTAYRHHTFFAGYRYRGRNIGHTTDSDSESTAVVLSLTDNSASRWAAQWRRVRLDRRGYPDAYNTVTLGPSSYESLQLSWEGRMSGQDISLQLGYEDQSHDASGGASGLFGFLQWRRTFD